MYRNILVPLDGSRFAESALPTALYLSRATDADIHLVVVVEQVPAFAFDDWVSAAKDWAKAYLREVSRRAAAHAGGEVTYRTVTGSVVECLEDEAGRTGADLVVMATHGRGVVSRMWLGSVAAAFIHHTRRPVLMLRPEEDDPGPPELGLMRRPRTIVVPLDGSELSEDALEHAVEFGALFGATYHLVRIVPYPSELSSPYLPATVQMNRSVVDEARRAAEAYLDGHAERLRARDFAVETDVRVGSQVAATLLEAICDADGDLVAMATHGRTGLPRALLGSVSDRVLRGTHVPLLLHRPRVKPA